MPRDSVIEPSKGLSRFIESWVDGVRRTAWLAMLAAIVLTGALGTYAVQTLRINTDTTDMLSRELPFRQNYEDYKAAFPFFVNSLVIVVDGANADIAEDAARTLERRLRARPEMFRNVFYPAGERFFLDNGLLYLDTDELIELSDRLAEAQPMLSTLARDTTLRGLFDLLGLAVEEFDEAGSPPAGFETAFDAISAVLEARARGGAATLSWTELIGGGEPDIEGRRHIIVTQPQLDRGSLGHAADAMAAVRRMAAEEGLVPAHGVRVRLTGSAALKTEELRSVSSGAGLAGIISLVLVGGLLGIGLRSLRLVISVLVTLVMGLVWTAGFAALAVGSLNLISVAFAVLFIGLGVDFGIHFALRYKEEFGASADHAQALRVAARGVGGALTLSAAAAAVAFFSFLPTAYEGVSELGLISGAGMFIALFANFSLLPALLTVLRFKPSERFVHRPLFTMSVERFIRHRRYLITGAAVVLGAGALAMLPLAKFDYNPLNLQDQTTESVQTVHDLLSSSRTPPYSISIIADNLDQGAALAEELSRKDFVDRAITIRNFVPGNQDEKLDIIDEMAQFLTPLLEGGDVEPPPTQAERRAAIDGFQGKLAARLEAGTAGAMEPAFRRMSRAIVAYGANVGFAPASLRALETALLGSLPPRLDILRLSMNASPITLDDLPQDIRKRYLSADGRVRVEVYPVEDLLDNEALRRFVSTVREVAPNATDNPVILLEAGDAVVTAFRQATIIALVLIVVLLTVVLRRLRQVMMVLAPLVLAACFTVATAVILGLSFNFANIIVLPLLLGLGVANGIHIVTRARREQSVTLLRTSTPRAIMFSALTTIGSFGSLLVSSHRGTASMGALLTIALAFTLVCSLVVLPALMEMPRLKLEPKQ